MKYSSFLSCLILVTFVHLFIFSINTNKPSVAKRNTFSAKVRLKITQDFKGGIIKNDTAKRIQSSDKEKEISKAVSSIANFKSFFNISPKYPYLSRVHGESGLCILEVLSDGTKIRDIRIKKSSGYERLDNAAIEAVKESTIMNGKEDLPKSLFAEIMFEMSN